MAQGDTRHILDQRLKDEAGNIINPATEDKQDTIISAINNLAGVSYNYIQSETGATYKYYGFSSEIGWQIKRKTLATGVWQYADGLFTGTYATYELAWAARGSISYANT